MLFVPLSHLILIMTVLPKVAGRDPENAAYLHYVANETIQGNALSTTTNAPLITDMSSGNPERTN